MVLEKDIYGWELILDLKDCNKNISNRYRLVKWAKELCKLLKMRPYGPCKVPYFGLKTNKTKGYSLLQFIEESAIVGHFSDAYRTAHINIFSCKKFDMDKALKFTIDYFSGQVVSVKKLERRLV